MTARRVEDVWVGPDHAWRAWVKRPLFASLPIAEVESATEDVPYRSDASRWNREGVAWLAAQPAALLIDLPGPRAIETALALGRHGFRPVLSINASSAPEEVVDMQPILALLVEGARSASLFPADAAAPPAFILDSRRAGMRAGSQPWPGAFDNRWTIFPGDLPSGEQLRAAGLGAVVIAHDRDALHEDVEAVAWSYRRAGLEVRLADVRNRRITVQSGALPGWVARQLATLRRRFSLRRRWDGSYGHRVPIPPEPSHG
jgi:hypothetical protein